MDGDASLVAKINDTVLKIILSEQAGA